MAYVVSYAEDHHLVEEQPFYAIPYETVEINQYVNLEKLANQLNVCLDDLTELNPELKRNVVPAGMTFPLKIPAARLALFEARKASILEASTSKAPEYDVLAHKPYTYSGKKGERIVHSVRNGETLGHIADKYGVSVSNLRYWNGLRGNLIRVGQKLVVYGQIKTPVRADFGQKTVPANNSRSSANPQPIPDGKVHIVRSGDNLWDIAKLYDGMTVEKLKKLNNLYNNKLQIGQALRLQ
jgi:membrane-bound lytic murein transglycosylase D